MYKVDYNDFLADLLMTPNYSNKTVDTIINCNEDCQFTGVGYRVLFFTKSHLESLCNSNQGLNYNQLLETIIDSSPTYQSFSKTLEGTKVIEKENLFSGIFKLVIKKDINKSLDIRKLYDKYKNCLDEETLEFYEVCKDEEEVLATMDNNFIVIEDKCLKKEVLNYL